MGPIEICLATLLAVAVAWDLKERKIPNAVTFPAMAVGLVARALLDGGAGLLDGLGGIGLGLALLGLPFATGMLGAGDVKLLMATGAFLGWKGTGWTFLYGSVVGGLLAVAVLLVTPAGRARLVRLWIQLKNYAIGRDLRVLKPESETATMRLPYALALAGGVAATRVLQSSVFP